MARPSAFAGSGERMPQRSMTCAHARAYGSQNSADANVSSIISLPTNQPSPPFTVSTDVMRLRCGAVSRAYFLLCVAAATAKKHWRWYFIGIRRYDLG